MSTPGKDGKHSPGARRVQDQLKAGIPGLSLVAGLAGYFIAYALKPFASAPFSRFTIHLFCPLQAEAPIAIPVALGIEHFL
jgi:hypothetical protein